MLEEDAKAKVPDLNVDLRFLVRRKGTWKWYAVLIEMKFSKKLEDAEAEAAKKSALALPVCFEKFGLLSLSLVEMLGQCEACLCHRAVSTGFVPTTVVAAFFETDRLRPGGSS